MSPPGSPVAAPQPAPSSRKLVIKAGTISWLHWWGGWRESLILLRCTCWRALSGCHALGSSTDTACAGLIKPELPHVEPPYCKSLATAGQAQPCTRSEADQRPLKSVSMQT